MEHKIVEGRCEVCGAAHGDIVTKGLECFLPEMASRRREELPATRVGVHGAPLKIATRFELEAVGIEWDGTVTPIGKIEYVEAGTLTVNEARARAAAIAGAQRWSFKNGIKPGIVFAAQALVKAEAEKNAARGPVAWDWEGTWIAWQNATSGNGIPGNAEFKRIAVHVWLQEHEEQYLFNNIDQRFDLRTVIRKRWPAVRHWRFSIKRGLGVAGTEFHFDEEPR